MTGPIVLPNYGEQLAEAFKNIGGGLAEIIAPNAPERHAFRKAVADNPEILQNLADLAYINGPESVFNKSNAKFIPQDIFDTIHSLKPSPEAVIRRAGAGAINTASPGQLTALGLGSAMHLPPLEAARQLALSPVVPVVAGQAPGDVGTTTAERGAYQTLTGEQPQEGAAGVVQGSLIQLAGKYINSLTPERRAQLGAYQAVPTLIADEHFMKQLALQEEIWRARDRDRISDMMARLHEQNIIWWQQNTGVGTTDGWDNFFSDKGRRRLEQLSGQDPKHPVTSLTADDRELIEIQRAFQAAPAEKRALDLNRADAGIRQLRTAIEKETDSSVRAGFIAALNSQLLNKARISGTEPIHAAWASSEAARAMAEGGGAPPGMEGLYQGFGAVLSRFRKLRFYNAKNEEVSADAIEAFSNVEAPTNTRGIPGAGAGSSTPGQPGAAGASAPPLAPPAPPQTKTKAQRWDELRAQMFPNVRTLTRGQVDSVTARVNAEMGP